MENHQIRNNTNEKVLEEKNYNQSLKKWLKNHFHPYQRIPIIKWLPKYRPNKLKGDIIAGLTCGLVMVPQSIAIASIVGVPPVFGLYSCIFPPIISLFLSTSPDCSVGVTVLVAIVASRYNPYGSPVYTSTIALFSGLVLLLAGLLNLGFIMNFVSFPVLTGFMTSGSISILVSQLPTLFGIPIAGSSQKSVYELIVILLPKILLTKLPDLGIGFAVIIINLVLHYTFPYFMKFKQRISSVFAKIILEIIWFIFIAKNVINIILMTAITYGVVKMTGNQNIITLTGKLEQGFPVPWIPIQPVNISSLGIVKSINQVLLDVYPAFFLCPVMVFIETLSVVKNFSKAKNYQADTTQELFVGGFSNIIGSFFRGFPIGGSLSRSAVNSLSGVNTSLSCLIVFIILLLSVFVLTPLFFFIPKASLAGMLISAVIPSINLFIMIDLWRANKVELFAFILTLLVGLYKLELGMLVGFLVTAGYILFKVMRPRIHRIHHTGKNKGSFSVRLATPLYFPSSEFLVSRIKSFKRKFPDMKELFIDCHAMHEIDYTVSKEFEQVVNQMKNDFDLKITFLYVKDGSVKNIMKIAKLNKNIQDTLLFPAEQCLHCHRYHVHSQQPASLIGDNQISVNSAPVKCGYGIKKNSKLSETVALPPIIEKQSEFFTDTVKMSLYDQTSEYSYTSSSSSSNTDANSDTKYNEVP